MVDQNLIQYIKDAKAKGASKDVIRQVLVESGWQQQQVDDAFSFIELQGNLPPAPLPDLHQIPPQQQAPVPTVTKKPRKPRTVSPYSSILFVALLFSLMILMNNLVYDLIERFAPYAGDFYSTPAYKDLCSYENRYNLKYDNTNPCSPDSKQYKQIQEEYKTLHNKDINRKLVIGAVVIIPFWLITAVLYFLLREYRERLSVLLMPYYITSVWLLIWLLFQTSIFILNTNTAFGVYMVLILLGAVLTGAVWAIQHYRNNSKLTA